MPFVKEENETVLWEGRPCITGRMKTVAILSIVAIVAGAYLTLQVSRPWIVVSMIAFWFLLPTILFRFAQGGRYIVTNRRVVREKFPFLQHLELQEIGLVGSASILGPLGLWQIRFFPKEPLQSYMIIFSNLRKGEPGKVKRIVEEAKQGYTTA